MPEFNYASFQIRVAAQLIDGIIFSCLFYIPLYLLGLLVPSIEGHDIMNFMKDFGALIASIIYEILMNASRWQGSLGKIILGIKITNLEGERITISQSCYRYFGMILAAIPLGYGLLRMIWSEQSQGLHDYIADTLVLKR